MSVTVKDLLELPSLRGATLVAGQGALKKLVSSISVLEYADPNILQDELFKNNEFFGSEIVITGFMNIPDDVEAQCANLKRLADAGEVGLILYYVGVFMPRVDQRLKDMANQNDFALIVMPENRMDMRYSDVICEVMEAIFKDQNNSSALVSDILGRTALLPECQRTLDAVLKLLSDRLRASAVLTDGALRLLNAVSWPRTDGADLEQWFSALSPLPEAGGPPLEVEQDGRLCYVYRSAVLGGEPLMELFLFKEGAPLPADMIRQAGEVVHLATSIWSQGHDRVVMSELVRAILKDEPIKMRRLAELFHVDVGAIHSMWLLRCAESAAQDLQKRALELVRGLLAHHCRTVVSDCYEGDVVAFMDWPGNPNEMAALAEECCASMREAGISGRLTLCQNLASTSEVRRAYLTIQTAQNDAIHIWPGRTWYTIQEMEFAQSCREIVGQGEKAVQRRLAVLAPLREGTEADLAGTLGVYFLDAGSSITGAAQRLFTHKNTIKYRLQQAAKRLGHPVDKLPEAASLYLACALERLLAP
jgi:sugar diacid utilization regulator